MTNPSGATTQGGEAEPMPSQREATRPTGEARRSPWPIRDAQAKPWTRWWWLGSAVDRAGLTATLEQYAAAGIGGVEVCPIYGAIGAEHRFVRFLSDEWVALLAHATAEANRLGMTLELTTGTGWPFGGPNVGPAQASCKIVLTRHEVAGGGRLDEPLGKGTFEHAVAVNVAGQSVDLRDRVTGDRIRWDAPRSTEPWRVIVAVSQSPVQRVKRAAPGGEGHVVNPYDTAALDHYLSAFDEALARSNGPKPAGHFHDSFEYYGADWTPAMFEEFERRRGYDLRTHLAAFAGVGGDEEIARVRCDYRQTIGELHLEYVARWTEWCHRHGGTAREQAHGAPANLIDLYAAADVPETELFGPVEEKVLTMNRLASSAAHLAGRPVASAEAFTWLGEHFQVTLADAKAEADFLFLAGINRLVFHGIAYSPPDVAWPGWLFYASVHFGPMGGLWRDLPALNAYLARCQSILQSGRPSRDVLLYFPVDDLWQTSAGDRLTAPFTMHDDRITSHPFHEASMTLWRRGYLFDQTSDHFLRAARFVDGKVEIGGIRYAAIVVPNARIMPVETLSQLVELAKGGATVIVHGELPNDVPGMREVEARRETMREQGQSLAEQRNVTIGTNLADLLAAAGVPCESMSAAGLLCERRAYDRGYAYFIVNRATSPFDGWVRLGTPARTATLMDPRDETRSGLAALRQRDGKAEIYLQLEPGETQVIRSDDVAALQPWRYTVAAGEPREVAGQWHVEFVDGGPELPASFDTNSLGSWTDRDDAESKRFAGTARYRVIIDHHEASEVDAWRLDLGTVCESARVRLNGHDVGTAWAAPYRVDVTDVLRPGQNRLEIEVTNLAANRIADLDRRGVPWKRFHEINFVNKAYKPFDASDWPLRASGLIGPVRLVPRRTFTPS